MLLNGLPILSGTISVPETGALSGYAECNVEIPTGTATLDGSNLVTVTSSTVFSQRCYVEISGGMGGLDEKVEGKHFTNASLSQILSYILRGTGETKSLFVDPALLLERFSFYSLRDGSVKECLGELAKEAGVKWRTLYDGTIWLGEGDPYLPTDEPLLLTRLPHHNTATYAVDGLEIRAGQELSIGRVTRVVYNVSNIERAIVWANG